MLNRAWLWNYGGILLFSDKKDAAPIDESSIGAAPRLTASPILLIYLVHNKRLRHVFCSNAYPAIPAVQALHPD